MTRSEEQKTAQTTTAEQEEDLELERLRREKEKAELERDIEKAKAAQLRESFPKAETKALEGKIAIGENLLLPGSVLAYASSSEIAHRLADDVRKISNLGTIIIYSEKEFGSIAAYRAALSQISAIQGGYRDILVEGRKGAAVMAPALLLAPELMAATMRSVADLVALFRTEEEIKAFSVAIDEVAVIAEFAEALQDVKIIYTPTYLPSQFLNNPIENSELAKELDALYKLRRESGRVVAAFDAKSEDEKEKDSQRNNIPFLRSLNDQSDKLNTYMASIDEKTGLNPLTMFLKAESLLSKLAEPNSLVMISKIHVGAGSNKITRNLFSGSKLYHTGGAVVTFLLIDQEGAIRFSKTYYCSTKYVDFDSDETWSFINNFHSPSTK